MTLGNWPGSCAQGTSPLLCPRGRRCSPPRPEAGAGRYPPGSAGGHVAAQSLRATARSPLHRSGQLESSPPALAQCGRVSHPGAAHCLAGRRPDRHCTDGTSGPSELARHEQGHTWRFAPVVEALQAWRGVQCTVAVTTVAERGDLTRCDTPRQLMHYLGLTPSAYSRGARRQQGGMTTTGMPPARRALVEGAWASRSPATVSRHLPLRLEQLPTAIQALSWKAQVRLCTRYRPLMATGKHANQVVVAMARAWRAFLWAMATHMCCAPQSRKMAAGCSQSAPRFSRPSAETQPRCGVTLGGVTRPTGPLVPRMRQAPDGDKEGGSQATDSRVITRRVFLAPTLPRDKRKKLCCRRKKVAPNP